MPTCLWLSGLALATLGFARCIGRASRCQRPLWDDVAETCEMTHQARGLPWTVCSARMIWCPGETAGVEGRAG